MVIEEQVQGIDLVLHTNEEVFSPTAVDKGTRAMLSFVEFREEDKVLDLGCGCGVVGILAAKQMLQAIQAKEKETQEKVNKEKAAALSSRQKEKTLITKFI